MLDHFIVMPHLKQLGFYIISFSVSAITHLKYSYFANKECKCKDKRVYFSSTNISNNNNAKTKVHTCSVAKRTKNIEPS